MELSNTRTLSRSMILAMLGISAVLGLCLMVFLEPVVIVTKLKGLAHVWQVNVFGHHFFNLEFWLVIALTLLLERIFPAVPRQQSFGLSFFQDLVWFLYEAVLVAIVIGIYTQWLKAYYARHFAALTITALVDQPFWLRFTIGVLLLDFLYWLQHWINHRVPWFWEIHAVHHSQRELNFFTDFRYHGLEYLVRTTVLVIPFLFLNIDVATIVGFSIFQRWYTRFYHGNIRTNLGPLRYVLVTPQSHRVHHSIENRHFDKNYGSILSIWDYLFGTQYRGYGEYPRTGIPDENFPYETSKSPLRVLLTPIIQHFYPIQKMLRAKNIAPDFSQE